MCFSQHFDIAYFTLAEEDLAYFTLCSRGTLFYIDAYFTLAEEEEQQADLIIFPSPSGPLGEACHFSTLPSHDHDDDDDNYNDDDDDDDDESGDMMVKKYDYKDL